MTEKLRTISLLWVECGKYQRQKNQEGLLPAGVRVRAHVFEGVWRCRWKCTQKWQGPLADPAQPKRKVLKQPCTLTVLPLNCGIVVQDVVPSTAIEKQSIIFLKSLSSENRFLAFYKGCSIAKRCKHNWNWFCVSWLEMLYENQRLVLCFSCKCLHACTVSRNVTVCPVIMGSYCVGEITFLEICPSSCLPYPAPVFF